MPSGHAWTKQAVEKKKATILQALATGASVTAAVKKASVSRASAYTWRDDDPAFRDAWDMAIESGTDLMEDEARRRAVKGVAKPVYQGGQRVGAVQEYSDTLLIFLLKGRRPEKFRDRVEHSGRISLEELLGDPGK